ncbi:hypothetical protein HK096_000838, partial [Nowakowskiella sp. JEL0078]
MMANPDKDIKKNCLDRFVTFLCEKNEFGKIVSGDFPFTGLQFEVESALRFKARNAPVYPVVSERPNYHKILFAYYVYRLDFQNASSTMYQYARRLGLVISAVAAQLVQKSAKNFVISQGSTLHDIVAEQARSYLSAINTLALTPEDMQWVLYNEGTEKENSRKRRKFESGVAHSTTSDLVENDEITEALSIYNNRTQITLVQNTLILTSNMKKEYALTMAKLTLASTFPHVLESSNNSLDTLLPLLMRADRFVDAVDLVVLFEGDLSVVFREFASKCVFTQLEN